MDRHLQETMITPSHSSGSGYWLTLCIPVLSSFTSSVLLGKPSQETLTLPAEAMLRSHELSDVASCSAWCSHCLSRVRSYTYQHTLWIPATLRDCAHSPVLPWPYRLLSSIILLSEGTHAFQQSTAFPRRHRVQESHSVVLQLLGERWVFVFLPGEMKTC